MDDRWHTRGWILRLARIVSLTHGWRCVDVREEEEGEGERKGQVFLARAHKRAADWLKSVDLEHLKLGLVG
jgi:hypothetical protein